MRNLTLLVACAVLALVPATQSFANFVNPGFENGNLTGWTSGGFRLSGTATSGQVAAITNSTDPRTNNTLQLPAVGSWCARVGDTTAQVWEPGPDAVISSWLSQREVVELNDLQDIYCSWAAVALQPTNGGHTLAETPFFQIDVKHYVGNTGAGLILHSEKHFTGVPGFTEPGWLQGPTNTWELGHDEAGIWWYRPWNTFHLNLTAFGIHTGDGLEIVLTTRDCSLRGHASYAYLDAFGATNPFPDAIPEPGTVALLGLGLATIGGCALRRARRG